MAIKQINDHDILTARMVHPITGPMHFERAYQDRRVYYRLIHNGNREAGLTDATHARESITKGWQKEVR